ncbi:MAG: hypothetical protein PF636_09895 [Actinomycetota bacterium]|jgi:hypothetical protein|nr:hypothetical protein [Actinomycetota bacterium]
MYTNKDVVRVMIVTEMFRIEGTLHVLMGSRLTDALNSKTKDFLAVTEAKIYSLADDKLVYEPEYIAVNRDSISCIFPLEET